MCVAVALALPVIDHAAVRDAVALSEGFAEREASEGERAADAEKELEWLAEGEADREKDRESENVLK